MSGTGRSHLRAQLRFLVVGGVAFLVDAGIYNLLVFVGGHGPLFDLPLVAKIISIAVATVVSYVGSRWFTFRDSQRPASARQFLLFAFFNVVAIGLQLGCLGFSRYVLGLHSALADNVSGTLIGQAIAMVFRYVVYARFVFPVEHTAPDAVAEAPLDDSAQRTGL